MLATMKASSYLVFIIYHFAHDALKKTMTDIMDKGIIKGKWRIQ